VALASTPVAHVWPETGVETELESSGRMILNFEADGDRGVWIEDLRHRWYYGRFITACPGVRFAQAIAVDTRSSARLDRRGQVLFAGDLCPFDRFTTAARPLPRKDRERTAKTGQSR
jgi:hypothetical protein